MSSREEDASRSSLPPTAAPSPTPAAHAGTVIAKGVKVEGEFSSQGDVVIEGEVQGNISSAGTLTVGSEAMIKADLKAEEANISGDITGSVTVAKQLMIHGSAKIKGDIVCERISIESGATLDGKLSVGAVKKEQMPVQEKAETPAAEPVKAAS